MNQKQLMNKILEEHKEYRPIPFWSWNNTLYEDVLVKQINEMKSAGIGGFIMHARSGLSEEYLGERWFSCIKACLLEARRLGMEAWVYDENGWPSGFVGGKLLENESYRAQFLDYFETDHFDPNAYVVFVEKDGKYIIADKDTASDKYYVIYLNTSPSNTDILNPEVTDAFIKETHEEYYKRFKEFFGHELYGFFTDEPQYFRERTPYSRFVTKELEQLGYNVKENLIYLFVHDEYGYEFRSNYYRICNKLYTDNYYKKIYDWCEAHNCKLTGHSVEECNISGQISCCSGVMGSYQYEQVPGIDWLGRNLPNDLIMRQVSSVSNQFGHNDILGEIFACCGSDVTPKELKSIADFCMFGGVTRVCNHLYPYSLSAHAKFDYPPVFSPHSGWFKEFKGFNEYIERLGYLVGNTKENYDIAIIHPLRSGYLEYVRREDYFSIQRLEEETSELLATLARNGVTYHLIDEEILANNGKIVGNELAIGACSYKTILIPKMDSISKETLNILSNFKGALCNLADIKYIDGKASNVNIESNITFKDIIDNAKLKFSGIGNISLTNRSSDLGDFVFIKNKSNTEPATIKVTDYQNYRILDLVNKCFYNLKSEYVINALDSVILVKNNEEAMSNDVIDKEIITESFKPVSISENFLVLDIVRRSFDGVNYSEKMPVQKVFDLLLRAQKNQNVFLKYEFNIIDKTNLTVSFEKAGYKSIKLNGKDISLQESKFDHNFVESNITDLVNEGVNEIIFEADFYQHDGVYFALYDPMATESLVNCLYYDTWLDSIYLKGDFNVDSSNNIIKKQLPKSLTNIVEEGYPFFKGEFMVKGTYNYDGIGQRSIFVDGKFLVANITIGNESVDYVFSDKLDITKMLKKGDNEVIITIKAGLRNLFGPLHATHDGIWPEAFSFRRMWKEDKDPDSYTSKYMLKPVGIKEISIFKVGE